MVVDLGLSTVLTFSTLLALLTASSTITDEIEGRTALTMLSKPLRREEFLLGKYLGVACTGLRAGGADGARSAGHAALASATTPCRNRRRFSPSEW